MAPLLATLTLALLAPLPGTATDVRLQSVNMGAPLPQPGPQRQHP